MLRRCIARATPVPCAAPLNLPAATPLTSQEPTPEEPPSEGPAPQEPTPEEWLDRCDTNGNGRVTCAEARAEACGAPIPVTKDHPLYQFMRDGDGDGQVCE